MQNRLLGWFTICCFGFLACCFHSAHADQRPNVLLIAVDDLNDWVGCLDEHPQTETPNIDRLAARGTLFTNAHCQGPICGPSRASLLSGLFPATTGVYAQPNSKDLTKDSEYFQGHLLPQYFASHGYKTMGCGKITHGFPMTQAFQFSQDIPDKFGPKPKGRFNYHLPDVPWTGTQTDWGQFPDVDEKMPDHRTANWAIKQLEAKHEKPFFLAVGFVRPHVPFYVPEKWFNRLSESEVQLPAVKNNDLDDVPEISRQMHLMPKYPSLKYLQAEENLQFRKCVHAYLASITFVDSQIGRVLDSLDQSRYAKNTAIVLFSDHGYHLGEKDRVSKHSLWEESTRVPLIVVKPGETHESTCVKPVGLIDIYPTLTQLCGLPAKKTNQGLSLLPLIQDVDSDWRPSIITTYARGNHALRSEQYRFIQYEDGSMELYDHKVDPHEWTNLANDSKYQPVIAKFQKDLPKKNAKYHEASTSGPVNVWFKQHFQENKLGSSKKSSSKKSKREINEIQ